MKINTNRAIPEKPVEMEGAKNVRMRILVGPDDGSDGIIMRRFSILPGGHTPHHSHAFEHVIKVEKGKGVAIDKKGSELSLEEGQSAFVPANSTHQFKNPYGEPFEFLCIIPNPEKKG